MPHVASLPARQGKKAPTQSATPEGMITRQRGYPLRGGRLRRSFFARPGGLGGTRGHFHDSGLKQGRNEEMMVDQGTEDNEASKQTKKPLLGILGSRRRGQDAGDEFLMEIPSVCQGDDDGEKTISLGVVGDTGKRSEVIRAIEKILPVENIRADFTQGCVSGIKKGVVVVVAAPRLNEETGLVEYETWVEPEIVEQEIDVDATRHYERITEATRLGKLCTVGVGLNRCFALAHLQMKPVIVVYVTDVVLSSQEEEKKDEDEGSCKRLRSRSICVEPAQLVSTAEQLVTQLAEHSIRHPVLQVSLDCNKSVFDKPQKEALLRVIKDHARSNPRRITYAESQAFHLKQETSDLRVDAFLAPNQPVVLMVGVLLLTFVVILLLVLIIL